MPIYFLNKPVVVDALAKKALNNMVSFANSKGYAVLTTEFAIAETFFEPAYVLTVNVDGGCDYTLWAQYVDEFLPYDEHNPKSITHLFNRRCIYKFK